MRNGPLINYELHQETRENIDINRVLYIVKYLQIFSMGQKCTHSSSLKFEEISRTFQEKSS